MIIVDMDNCISDDKWRIPLIHWSNPNKFLRYHPYHMAAPGDQFCNRHLFDGRPVTIITSRPIMYKWLTVMWLDYHKIAYKFLFMRQVEDANLTSAEVKRKALRNLTRVWPLKDISIAYDDRPDVIEMYKMEGVPATVLAIHNYETKEWYEANRPHVDERSSQDLRGAP